MVAVPVEGKEKFQKTLDAVFAADTTAKGKAYAIPMLGKSVYAKPGESYFLLSDSPAIIAAAKADPPAPVAVADIAMESMLDAVPEDLREAAAQISAEARRALELTSSLLSLAPSEPSAADRKSVV